MEVINTYEAKAHLSALLTRAAAGERIVIARDGKPLACLVPYTPTKPRRGGTLKGQIQIAEDFDAPLPSDMADAFGMGQP